jgi:hypothetical protein
MVGRNLSRPKDVDGQTFSSSGLEGSSLGSLILFIILSHFIVAVFHAVIA